MLRKLVLKNWKTHKYNEITFSKGVNIIIGIMGAGKSSVLDAISYALYGRFPASNRKEINIKDVITDRPIKEDSASVELEFDVGNDIYKVVRSISRSGKAEATLYKNNRLIQTQPTKVTEEIEAALKVDYDTFSRVIYAEQNKMLYFIDMQKSERKKQIDSMIGLDQLFTSEQTARSVYNSIKALIEDDIKNIKSLDKDSLKKRLDELVDRIEELIKERDQIYQQLKLVEEQLSVKSKQLNELKTKKRLYEELSREVDTLRGKIEGIESSIKRLEEESLDSSIIEELNNAVKERDAVKRELDSISRELDSIKSIKINIERDIEESKKRKAELDSIAASISDINQIDGSIKDKEDQITKARSDISVKYSLLKDNQELLSILNKEISECPVCEREIPADMKERLISKRVALIDNIKKEIDSLNSLVYSYERELRELKSKRESEIKLRERMDYLSKNIKDIDELSRRLNEIAIKENELINKQKELRSNQESLDTKINELLVKKRRYDDLQRYKQEHSQLVIKLEEIIAKRDSISINEAEVEPLEREVMDLNAKRSNLDAQYKAKEEHSRDLDTQRIGILQQIKNIEEIERKIDKRRKELAFIDTLIAVIKGTEADLRNELIDSINRLMSEIWLKAYPYSDYLSIRFNPTEDDYKLEGQIAQDRWISIEGFASGGEKSVASIVMRVAMASVLVPNLRWLILDEPTHNIDSKGINSFANALSSGISNIVEQVLVITHEESLKSISNANILIFDRDKASNGYTAIRALYNG